YLQHKYVVELKRWYGEQAHQRGLDQLADYLDRQELEAGWLVVFEHKGEKSWRQAEITHRNKRIFVVWV
ncbi:MAG: AAA family ATPase, partial [Bacteroidota bacterium]